MVTWARVVLLQQDERILPYERIQAYRILSVETPQTFRPRLARALGDFVDRFTPEAPPAACEALLVEAATALRDWAATLVADGVPATELLTAARRRDPVLDWSPLAASVAYAAAGRGDAALDLAGAYA